MGEAGLASAPAPKGAETYSSAMADAKNYISWILSSFSGYLAAPVLEIGVGHGSYASVLRGYGDYVGVDIDPASVEEARQRFPDLDFRVADITSPDFVALANERMVRTIVCLNVIEHIEDDGKAVTNLARALQPGGHLLVIVPALNDSVKGTVTIINPQADPRSHTFPVKVRVQNRVENDQPVLCDEKVRFEGDKVALVVANSADAAGAGARLVAVD